MNKKLVFIIAFLAFVLSPSVYAQKGAKEDVKRAGTDHSKCKAEKCEDNRPEDDVYLPISREQAETLITKIILEARAPYVEAREKDRIVWEYKRNHLMRRLIDEGLRRSYASEYNDRIARLENMIAVLLVSQSKGSKLDPSLINQIFTTQAAPASSPAAIGFLQEKREPREPKGEKSREEEGGAKLQQSIVVSPVTPPVEEISTFLSQVFFPLNKATISAKGAKTIEDVKEWMQANPSVRVVLRGYASPEGNVKYNNHLSARRVNAVADSLVRLGISRDRLVVLPSGVNSVTDTLEKARRVDIKPELCD